MLNQWLYEAQTWFVSRKYSASLLSYDDGKSVVFFQCWMEHGLNFINLKYSENAVFVSLQYEMPCHFCLSVSVLHMTLSQFCWWEMHCLCYYCVKHNLIFICFSTACDVISVLSTGNILTPGQRAPQTGTLGDSQNPSWLTGRKNKQKQQKTSFWNTVTACLRMKV